MYGLKEWVVIWLENYKRVHVKPSTYDSYVCVARNISCNVPIDELTCLDVQGVINRMVLDKKAYSTIKHVLTLIRQALNKSLSLGLIRDLRCLDNLELPKSSGKRIEGWSDSDIRKLLACAYASDYGDLFLTLFYSGCRIGELLALRWEDVEFGNRVLRIRNTDYKGTLQSTKTHAGERAVPLYEELYSIIRKRRLRLDINSERVFTDSDGKPLRYRRLLEHWHSFCSSHDLPVCGFHVLRHSFARWSIRQGIPLKVVSSILGHSSPSITLNIYDYVDIDDITAAGDVLNTSLTEIKKAL